MTQPEFVLEQGTLRNMFAMIGKIESLTSEKRRELEVLMRRAGIRIEGTKLILPLQAGDITREDTNMLRRGLKSAVELKRLRNSEGDGYAKVGSSVGDVPDDCCEQYE
ncbi:hypothetical protein [Jannaschia sp. W003]|uniref:hypothetical protein n=1 Tax=Jannaschia sp. W003 TaxID=2867012 RepID=UPI0021A90BEE|nr:hypothetical protein [Jannaschia sp. W003]UWQ20079.1 hypothetical protein K3554_08650 [Jannaschia sp. W003]